MSREYSTIDAAVPVWLATRGLHMFTESREEEVRSVFVVDDTGTTFQIWFDHVGSAIEVHAGDPADGRRRWAKTIQAADLPNALDEVWSVVSTWIHELGHTRTPYIQATTESSAARDIREH
jgi:hypothetical protein